MPVKKSKDVFLLLIAWLLLGIPCLFLAIYVFSSSPAKQLYALDGYEKGLIDVAVRYVSEHKSASGKLPTEMEFSQWINSHEREYPRVAGAAFSLLTSSYPADLINRFGIPGQDGYVLEFWNGDLMVSYPSWSTQKNIAYITDKEYYPFEGRFKSIIAFLIFPVFLMYLTINCAFRKSS